MLPTVFLIHTCDISSKIGQNVKQIAHGAVTGTFLVGQTITGTGGGVPTGKVYAVGAGYLQYQPLTGTFTTAQLITGATGSTTSTAGPANAVDSFGVPIVVPVTQTGVACRFVAPKATKINTDSGEHFESLPKLLLGPTISVTEGDRITGNNAGYLRTYEAKIPKVVYEAATATVSHLSVELEAVA